MAAQLGQLGSRKQQRRVLGEPLEALELGRRRFGSLEQEQQLLVPVLGHQKSTISLAVTHAIHYGPDIPD